MLTCLVLVDLELLVERDRSGSLAAVLQLISSLLEPLYAFIYELPLAVVRPQMDEETVVSPLPSLQANSPRSNDFSDESAHSSSWSRCPEYLDFIERDRQR